jgi:hypothetical protein
MYRLIALIGLSFLIMAACSQPVRQDNLGKSEICQQISKQMINNSQNTGQPQADSAQITQAQLLKQYKDNNCY